MTAKILKVAVVGGGFIHGVYHMPSYRNMAEVNVIAACAATKEEVELFADRWGIRRRYYGEDGIERLCADPDVDLVDVGLPNFLHLRAIRAAAENHKHVICEKPLAKNVQEAEEMVALTRRYGVIDCYAENQVFMPQVVRAKEFISNGALGRPFWVRAREAHFGPHSKWFWEPELAGGGVLMDMGCHSIEVGRYLIGRKPVSVCAWASTFVHKTRAEENSVVMVNHEESELTQAENSWAGHGGFDLRIEIYGSEGAIYIDATKGTGVQMFTVASEEKVGAIVEKSETKKGWMFPTWDEVVTYGFQSELRHFVSSILQGESPRETFEDGLMINKVVDAAYRSMKSKRWESV
jgi:predicted dehydrogenase